MLTKKNLSIHFPTFTRSNFRASFGIDLNRIPTPDLDLQKNNKIFLFLKQIQINPTSNGVFYS